MVARSRDNDDINTLELGELFGEANDLDSGPSAHVHNRDTLALLLCDIFDNKINGLLNVVYAETARACFR